MAFHPASEADPCNSRQFCRASVSDAKVISLAFHRVERRGRQRHRREARRASFAGASESNALQFRPIFVANMIRVGVCLFVVTSKTGSWNCLWRDAHRESRLSQRASGWASELLDFITARPKHREQTARSTHVPCANNHEIRFATAQVLFDFWKPIAISSVDKASA